MTEERDDAVTSAVILGKLEVKTDQLLDMMTKYGQAFEEVWTRLRTLELAQERADEWRVIRERNEASRPNWATIASLLIGAIGLASALGIIGYERIAR